MSEKRTVENIEVDVCFCCKKFYPIELLKNRVVFQQRSERVCDGCERELSTAKDRKKRLMEG